jgi:hypothetical protein
MARRPPLLAILSILAAALLFPACERTPTITTAGAGHTITARIEGHPTVQATPELATIAGPHGKVQIETTRLRLDDLEWVDIPAGVAVDVLLVRHKARVTAGPVTISRTITN